MNQRRQHAVVIDVYSRGHYHEAINVSVLVMALSVYRRLTVVAAPSARSVWLRVLTDLGAEVERIEWQQTTLLSADVKPEGSVKVGERLWYSWLNYWHYMRAPRGADVIYLNNIFLGFTLVDWLSLWRRDRIVALCHGEMSVVDPSTASTRGQRLSAAYFGFVLRHTRLSRRITLVVLSPGVAGAMRDHVAAVNRERIAWIDHAYVRPPMRHVRLSDFPLPHRRGGLKVGLPSVVKDAHGAALLRDVVAMLDDVRADVTLYAMSATVADVRSPRLVRLSDGGMLPYDAYWAYFEQMDAVLLPYPADGGRMTASGALLEAVWHGRPIVATPTPYVDELTARFGAFCIVPQATPRAVVDALMELAAPSEATMAMLAVQQEQRRRIRDALMPDAVVDRFAAIVGQ